MIKLENFDNYPDNFNDYGGRAGKKRGIIYKGENWLIKYPGTTSHMTDVRISYTTAPLSEYIACLIYKSIGIDVQQVMLGFSLNKVVVACKDFLNENEKIVDFNSIKNKVDITNPNEDLSSSNSLSEEDLDDVEKIMQENTYFQLCPNLKERFWDMFIIDAFLGNNDRNDGNWGVIRNYKTGIIRLAPVFDNGASFNNKNSEEKFKQLLDNPDAFINNAYHSVQSHFSYKGKNLNPLKYIESMKNSDCNEALLRIFPKISIPAINDIINNIPLEYNQLPVISAPQKEFYIKCLNYRHKNILEPVYSKLKI